MHASRANSSRACGMENLLKTSPVATAATTSAAIDSTVTASCAVSVFGYMAP